MIRRAVAMVLVSGGLAAAQTPPDQGRQPAFNPGQAGSAVDQGRIPVLDGAGTGLTIQSFPSMPAGPLPAQQQPAFQGPRPVLSPYLNLFAGGVGGGFSAVDYFNLVRPAQQASGSFIGRPMGAQMAPGGRGFAGAVDPESGLQSSPRPAGTPSSFMTHGGYFNRLGSIGMTGRQPGFSAPTPTATQPGRPRR
jgi:hypothetical protein